MNLYEVLRRIWAAKLVSLTCAVLAAAVGVLVAFQISLSPVGLRPRALQLGVAGIQLLVDSRRSSIGNAGAPAGTLAGLAGDYTELIGSSQVIQPIARSIGVAPYEIGVSQQLTQDVPLSQSQPTEPQVGTQILAARKHYSVTARNDSGSQVIQIYTQAPTGQQAIAMAAAAGRAIARFVANHAAVGLGPKGDRVVVTPVGDVTGRTIDRGASTNLAVIVGLLVWVFGMIAVIALQDQIGRARAQRTAPPVSGT